MTVMARARAATAPPASRSGRRALAGTLALVRLRLRRDRVVAPAWTLGVAGLVLYFTAALDLLFETEEDLLGLTAFMDGPLGALMGGPGYGFDDPSLPVFLAGTYWLYIMVLVGIMAILLTVRHTRREEAEGRTELVLGQPVGRLAPLASAIALVVGVLVVVALLTVGMLLAAGYPATGSWAIGAGTGALGLVMVGLTALTAQVAASSRAAGALAGVGLGVAFVVRSVGDLLEPQGSWLSWLSPLAWSQQMRPYVDERWWPLLLTVALAALLTAAAAGLAARRDLGAGALVGRPGPARAPGWLATPLALALRVHRGTLLGWAGALTVLGVVYGSMTQELLDSFQELPAELVTIMGGQDDLLAGYLALMALFDAVIVSVFALLALHTVRAEEATGRAGAVLSATVSRWAWLGSHLVVVAGGALALLALCGVALGGTAALVTGDAGLLIDGLWGHLALAPGVLVMVGVGAVLVGAVPRALLAAWVLLAHVLLTGVFGEVMDLPEWLDALSPFAPLAEVPLEGIAWPPVAALTALALALGALGAAALRRRDLQAG